MARKKELYLHVYKNLETELNVRDYLLSEWFSAIVIESSQTRTVAC
jgi:hypothetical protein